MARNIEVKFSGECACCGAPIKAGSVATYYPAGTIAGVTVGKLAHIGGLDGNSVVCFNRLKLTAAVDAAVKAVDAAVNDFAGDGLDERWEDSYRDICGL
jgi:hypothetical protein